MFILHLPLALFTTVILFYLLSTLWVTHALLIFSSQAFNLFPVFCYYKEVPLIGIPAFLDGF